MFQHHTEHRSNIDEVMCTNSNEQVAAKWKIYQISLEADNNHPKLI